MTLLEALTALVILGLSVTGYLTVFDGAARAARRADDAARLVAHAEAALAEAALAASGGGAIAVGDDVTPPPAGLSARLEARPWRGSGLVELVVTVRAATGDSVRLRRLARRP